MALTACGSGPPASIEALPADLPRFESKGQPIGVARANSDIARDILDLMFQLESGERVDRLLKYDRPVRVYLNSPSIATYQPEIDNLLSRLRREARIDIAQTANRPEAQIFIEAVPRRSIQRAFPGAACFIIPGVRSWAEFRSPPPGANLRWSRQLALGPTTVFIPSDSTPQDTRDCLHEEIAQALGPANDLFRIHDSIFNDDNFHSVLTPFDMIVLRALYSDRLTNGMTRDEVAQRLPGILSAINAKGRNARAVPQSPDTKAWKRLIERALDRRNSRGQRRAAADRSIDMAGQMNPTDHRLGLAILTLGRIEARNNPERAADLFRSAQSQFDAQFGRDNIRSAHVAIHLSLDALRRGNPETAAAIARFYQPRAAKAENAVILSGLLAIEAEALRLAGNIEDARQKRITSLKWARYAFGDRQGVIARAQAEIADYAKGNAEQ
jgi:hypothetical protein